MDWLTTAQAALRADGLDAWLLYDFRGVNTVARARIAPILNGGVASRRVFLLVPAAGEPVLLVHAIERGSVPAQAFEVRAYSSRASLEAELRRLLTGRTRLAMEYSPAGDNPYVGIVDAGTVELVRSLGVEVASSGNVAQALETWSSAQVSAHLEAAEAVLAAKDRAFGFLAERLELGRPVRETEVQDVITQYFQERDLTFDHPPNVSFGAHAGDPHYVPRRGQDAVLAAGQVVLIDLWAKLAEDGAPYADVTWMGVCGEPDDELVRAFEAVKAARDAAFRAIAQAWDAGERPEGREIDRVARDLLASRGYGDEVFIHRTGHSLGTAHTHGDAVHLDDFETCDRRRLLTGLGLTIEPGVYFPDFGVRSEIDVLLEDDGPRATTDLQADLERLPVPRA
ncbi:MAG: M24 family metallopeptidase [Deinococcales bacterium]